MTLAVAVVAAVCAGYVTFAAADMVDSDDKERSAKTYLIISSAIYWIVVGGCILEIIGLVMFAEELMLSRWGSAIVKYSNFLLYILLIVGAIMAIVGASALHEGKDFAHNQTEYSHANNAALIGFVFGGVVLITYGASHLYASYKMKHRGYSEIGGTSMFEY